MGDQIKESGIKGNLFYVIEKIDDYYSLWVIDKIPKNMEEETLKKFMVDHITEGSSSTGSYEDVLEELKSL